MLNNVKKKYLFISLIITILSLFVYFVSLIIYYQKNIEPIKSEYKIKTINKKELNKNSEQSSEKSKEFSSINISSEPKIEKNQDLKIELKEFLKNNTPIYFIEDTVILKENEINKLRNLSQNFKNTAKIELEVKGYADSVGKPDDEFVLSLHRAEFVKEYFSKECPNVSFEFKVGSYGSSSMVYTGDDIEKRYLNRRVELELINAIK
jgi:outer membrane protein OmpA-like peptidoglycan-associated protein